MKTYARTYWFTWGFLVLAALFTGGAVSLKDASSRRSSPPP
jgi:hypothetical protein